MQAINETDAVSLLVKEHLKSLLRQTPNSKELRRAWLKHTASTWQEQVPVPVLFESLDVLVGLSIAKQATTRISNLIGEPALLYPVRKSECKARFVMDVIKVTDDWHGGSEHVRELIEQSVLFYEQAAAVILVFDLSACSEPRLLKLINNEIVQLKEGRVVANFVTGLKRAAAQSESAVLTSFQSFHVQGELWTPEAFEKSFIDDVGELMVFNE